MSLDRRDSWNLSPSFKFQTYYLFITRGSLKIIEINDGSIVTQYLNEVGRV